MMKQIVQDFSENGYEVAGLNLAQPIDISDDEKLGQICDQSEFLILEVVMMTV